MQVSEKAPLRPVAFGDLSVSVEHRADGAILVRPKVPLGPYPARITDALIHWGSTEAERLFMAERRGAEWHKLTYGEALKSARHIASALLNRGLNDERPIVILAPNSLNHLLMSLGALFAGIPFCPISTAYALASQDYARLAYVLELLTPGLVFLDDATPFAAAISKTVANSTEIVAASGTLAGRTVTPFADLLTTPVRPDLDQNHAAIGPERIAKFLLTSGSTGHPKAVINTQKMLCSNVEMINETLAFLKKQPLVMLDWLPWNHTFGGNHNINIALYNGGSFYIDEGKPVPGGFEKTLRNLREVPPTVYFNVPKGYEALVEALKADAELRKIFFSRLEVMFFAGASLPRHIWDALDALSMAETGMRVPMLTGLGATETAPFCMTATPQTSRSGHVGQPTPGNDLKLVPNGGKLEMRVKGPNVTPGYWRQSDATAKSFDEEGFYKLGDALKPAEPDNLHAGFNFDGRISEDFKLTSGTWVSVGPLRMRLIAACEPLVRDAVIAGLDHDSIAAILLLDADACRSTFPHLKEVRDMAELASDVQLRARLLQALETAQAGVSGSSNLVRRVAVLNSYPSIDAGEITDKGSINQRNVLSHRAALVEDLYAAQPSSAVMTVRKPA